MIIGLFAGEAIFLWVINIPFIEYFGEQQVERYKDDMVYFSYSHQNPSNGLFIEPTIDLNYRAVDSVNFSSSEFSNSKLIDPINNSLLIPNKKNFFIDYLFEKQNIDGSYSDIGGIGNMYDTYKVIRTIELLNNSYLDTPRNNNRINSLISFLNESLEKHGWGFKVDQQAPEADIVSTYYGIKLAKRFDLDYILQNENLTKYIELLGNSTFFFSGNYRFSNNTYLITAETSYFGIRAYLALNNTYNSTERSLVRNYYSSLYNIANGGYKSTPSITSSSDIRSTYYSLWSLYQMNTSLILTENFTLNYILSCVKPDGGFGITWFPNITSDQESGWAGMKAIFLLEINASIPFSVNQTVKINYYNWLYEFQGINGLIGQTSLQINYFGLLSLYNYDAINFINYVNMDSILNYTDSCFNPIDGGYGSQPPMNSSIFSTYCAIAIYEIFEPFSLKILPNPSAVVNYFSTLQNKDGGFKLGEDLNIILSYFGSEYNPLLDFINTNISTVESTYWALSSLNKLEALDHLNLENLTHWIQSCQNADGGFSIFLGFHSDVISTYYGLEIHKLLNLVPLSEMSAIEFLKLSQSSDGSFTIIPFLSSYINLPSSFLATYLGSISLYRYRSQPENIQSLVYWYRRCISTRTGGVGDLPSFGADLRNTPYGLLIIDQIRYDQAFDPLPWSRLLIWIMIAEVIVLMALIIYNIVTYLNVKIMRRLKSMLGLGGKLNINYLKRFSAIYCENLNIYAGRKLIVDGVTLELDHGEILGVLGESGAGKSTFIKALLGMRKYTGVCEIYGMDAKKNRRRFRPVYGYVPQDLGKIYTDFTTIQNLMYFGKQYGLTEKQIISRSKRILRSLEIEDKINELVKNLSGGQKRRVSIAMALIHEPIFCILDEPTSGLDPIVRESLWLNLTKINEKFGTTLIVISHYPEESRFCNKVVIFGRGRGMIDFGTSEELLSQLPGGGRTIELYFYEIQDNAIQRLESIEGIEKALENKIGTDFAILTERNMSEIRKKIEEEFGENTILGLKQADSKMEEYFRYKAMEVPEIE